MIFPEKPTCHNADWRTQGPFKVPEAHWRDPREHDGGPYKETFRTCYFCGSIHPEDLLKALQAGAIPRGSDWKYGWPHKFYIEGIPNPIAGQPAEVSSTYKDGVRTPTMGPAPAAVFAKWYNEHLQDEGFDDDAWNALSKA